MKTKKSSAFARQSAGDRALLIVAYAILGLFLVAIIFPIIYIILSSFIDPITLQNKGVTFDFSKWTLMAYERVLGNAQIWVGFKNALLYSIEATILGGVVTLLAAYPMSRPDFRGRGFFNVIFVITMFFGGGLIPTYLLISDIGWLDNPLAILVPGEMFAPAFDQFGLHRKNLSRMLEDTGTAFSPIVPWSNISVFILGTLGVSSFEYVLYAPITYLGVVFAAIYIMTGFGIYNQDDVMLVKEKRASASRE